MDDAKNLLEFLQSFQDLTKKNIKFLIDGKTPKRFPENFHKYKKEFEEVQSVINSFSFVKSPKN